MDVGSRPGISGRMILLQREPLTVKAKNLTEACAIVERSLKPGDKYYKYVRCLPYIVSNQSDLLEFTFTDERLN